MTHHDAKFDIVTIKDRIDSHDFYLREQNLTQYGYRSGKWAVAGLCPFHPDGKPGSFKVNLENGAFKCFSCGAHGGDIIAYLQQRDQLSFREAVQYLINEWGHFHA